MVGYSDITTFLNGVRNWITSTPNGSRQELDVNDAKLLAKQTFGKILTSFYSLSSTTTETVSGNAIAISNDGNTILTVTTNAPNSPTITVNAGESIGNDILLFGAFTTVTVTTTVACRLWVYT